MRRAAYSACCGWSSNAIGAPNTAKIPSPVDWATYPPYRWTASIISLSAGSTIARASSGSRFSISSIDPLISAKSAVTVFRSPALADKSGNSRAGVASPEAVLAAAGRLPFASRLKPQSRQNFAGAVYSAPHLGHLAANGLPHSAQNLVPAGFSELHLGQRIIQVRARYGLTTSPRWFLYMRSRQANTSANFGSSPSWSR